MAVALAMIRAVLQGAAIVVESLPMRVIDTAGLATIKKRPGWRGRLPHSATSKAFVADHPRRDGF